MARALRPAGASRQRHANTPWRSSRTSWTDRDLHIAPEGREQRHQPLHRKPFEPAVDQCRHLGLIDAQDPGRACLSQTTLFQNLLYLDSQQDFGPSLLGMRKAKVGEFVAGAFLDTAPVLQLNNYFCRSL